MDLPSIPKAMDHPPKLDRGAGFWFLVMGLLMAYNNAYLPWDAARNHAEHISISVTVTAFLMPFCVFTGTTVLVFGDRFFDWCEKTAEKSFWNKIIVYGLLCTLVAGGGWAFHWWLKSTIAAYGYGF